MKFLFEALISTLLACILTIAAGTAAQAQSAATVQAAQQATPARAAKPASDKTPQAGTTLTAPGAVTASAACCQKTCPDGPAHCGTGCTVVKSLSDCAGEVFKNITFECPANKGMICQGSACSCQ